MMYQMTVKELINHLQTFEEGLLVTRQLFSEQCLLQKEDITVEELGKPRPDGWVANKRPDKPVLKYVVFAGN